MSMGYDNNTKGRNNSDVREPYIYSNIKMRNPQSTLDQCALNFQFMYGLLNIYMAPKKEESSGDFISYDYEKKISIWLSYNHAKIFASEIRRLMEVADPSKLRTVGVTTKDDTLITFGYGTEYGTENFILAILKLNGDGSIQQTYIYEFPTDRYASIVNFDPNTKKYDKHIVENVEIEQLLDILDDYSRSINGAYSYANQYYSRFSDNSRYNMMASIATKLGINTKGNYSKPNSGGGFFSNGSPAMNAPTSSDDDGDGFRNRTLDDMDGDMEFE